MTRSSVRLANSLAIACTLVWCVATAPATAEPGFPNRTVRIFVPYGPGGVGDLTMRLVAQKLTERMGKQVIIENRPGAGGVLAAKATMDSPADGYTMLVTGNGTAISMSLFKVRPYNALTDFTQISVAASFEMLIATPADSPYKTVQGIIQAARANPGKLNLAAIRQQHPGSVGTSVKTHRHRRRRHLSDHADLITALILDVDVVFDFTPAQSAIATTKSASSRRPTKSETAAAECRPRKSGLPDYVVTS